MANPPIVIGTMDNVPAPGSPIRSDWPQEISTLITTIDNRLQKQTAYTGFQAGLTTITTNASGVASIVFPQTMSAIAGIIVVPSSAEERWVVISHYTTWSTTGFSVTVWRGDGSVSNTNSLRISYWAFGAVQ